MENKNVLSTDLPKHIQPLEFEAKAYRKEMPPILILAEKQSGLHCPKLRVWSAGKEPENEELIDKFDGEMRKMATTESSLFNQEPKSHIQVSWISGWEFLGKGSMDQEQKLFITVKEFAIKMNMPLYYQGSGNKLHLVPNDLQDSKELLKLVENNL